MAFPYDNEYMVYDYDEHRYVLTPKAVLDKVGEDLNVVLNKGRTSNPQVASQVFLDDISDFIYEEIYSYSNQNAIQEVILAKVGSARGIIQKAMLEQVKYVLVNGQLELYGGVDVKKGTVMPDFSARTIAPHARQVLSREITEIGRPITYQGHYQAIYVPKYEELKY